MIKYNIYNMDRHKKMRKVKDRKMIREIEPSSINVNQSIMTLILAWNS